MKKEECKDILIITEVYKGQIHRVSYELLNKCQEFRRQDEIIECLALAHEKADFGELCLRGADVVTVMDSQGFAEPNEVLFAKNIVSYIKERKPAIVLIGATHFGRSLGPKIAAALETGLTADCTDLKVDDEGNLEQIRPAFSDNILAHIKTITGPQMATVRYKEFDEAERDISREINVRKIQPYFDKDSAVEIIDMISLGQVDITDAEVIIAGGRGIKKEEDLELLQNLADALGGQVGVSRALVDIGMAPSSIQVGYSGNRVKPKIYIACGISGAPQHLAGMKESDYIVAINSDPSAPIFNIANCGIVGDLYDVVPRLTAHFTKIRPISPNQVFGK